MQNTPSTPRFTTERFQISTGQKTGGSILGPLRVGDAFLSPDRSYYVLRLCMLSRPFFLAKKHEAQGHYTVFARKVGESPVRFQDPVGRAFLRDDLQTHLEIEFPFIGNRVYMSLFPNQSPVRA